MGRKITGKDDVETGPQKGVGKEKRENIQQLKVIIKLKYLYRPDRCVTAVIVLNRFINNRTLSEYESPDVGMSIAHGFNRG